MTTISELICKLQSFQMEYGDADITLMDWAHDDVAIFALDQDGQIMSSKSDPKTFHSFAIDATSPPEPTEVQQGLIPIPEGYNEN